MHPAQDENRWLGDYGSPLRDNALKLALLEENKLLPEVQNQLLSTLSEEAYGQRWLSTQETNALFLAGRTLADLPGSWQAKTSLQAEPLAGDKAQTRNLDGDRLAALQVSNTGSQPLWLRSIAAVIRKARHSREATCWGLNALFSIPTASRNR